jgi:hypothetical protein
MEVHLQLHLLSPPAQPWQTETRPREAFFQPSILWQESRLKYPNQAGMLFLNHRIAPRRSRLKYKHYNRLISTVAPSDKTSITDTKHIDTQQVEKHRCCGIDFTNAVEQAIPSLFELWRKRSLWMQSLL